MRKKQEKKTWYPLDNAGVLYSALQKERYSAVYRFSAVMTQTVDPLALQRAVPEDHAPLPRLPRPDAARGLSGATFEPNPSPGPFVRPDMANPCQPIRFREDNGLARPHLLLPEPDLPGGVPRRVRRGRGLITFSANPAGGLPPGAGAPHPQRPRPPGRRRAALGPEEL